jgi:hypothetical protein
MAMPLVSRQDVAGMGVVVHHLMFGAHEHDQGIKESQIDMVAGFGGKGEGERHVHLQGGRHGMAMARFGYC